MKFQEFGSIKKGGLLESKQEDLEDIKWILVEMSEQPKLAAEALGGKALLYDISDISSPEDVDVANRRLAELGYCMVYIGTKSLLSQKSLVCWIVSQELFLGDMNRLPMSPLKSDYYFDIDMKSIQATQKGLIIKHCEKEPALDIETLSAFFVIDYKDRRMAKAWQREYLGDKVKERLDSMLKGVHSISKEGYDFRFSIDRYEISEESRAFPKGYFGKEHGYNYIFGSSDEFVTAYCSVLEGGTVDIIMDDGRTMNIEDAVEDKEIGFEITADIKDCIIEYLYDNLRINDKTGFNFEVEMPKGKWFS